MPEVLLSRLTVTCGSAHPCPRYMWSSYLTSCCRSHAAETGRLHRYVGPGDGNIETLLDDASFGRFAQPRQAFVKSMQTPDVLWMLTGSRQGAVEAEIGAVDRLCLLYTALFQQQRS